MNGVDETIRPGSDPLEGSVIAGFHVVKKIGQGAMGMVYLAKQVSLDRFIALKILPPNPAFLQAETISRFMREARTAASLSHINIVQVHDAGEHEGLYFIAMEYVRGAGLSEILRGLKRLPEAAAVEAALQTSQGLGAAADRGVIHRDIKPANLMVTENFLVKVADFGLAKALDKGAAGLTETGKVIGTPSYMSPEQAESKKADLRSDIFSLGVTFFESATGQKPFLGDSIAAVLRQVVDSPAPDPRSIREDLSPDTSDVILRMLEKNPDDRYQNYPELIQDLLMIQRSVKKTPGYLDSAKIFVKNIIEEREEEIFVPRPQVTSAAKTIALGGKPASESSGTAPPSPTMPTPLSFTDEMGTKVGPVPFSMGSMKPFILGAAAGAVILCAAVLTVFLLFLKGPEEEPKPTLAPGSAFNLEVIQPPEAGVIAPGMIKVEGRFSGKTPDTITVNGQDAWIEEGAFGAEIPLEKHGKAVIEVTAKGEAGTEETLVHHLVVDTKPPTLEFDKQDKKGVFYTRESAFVISGHLRDGHPAEVLAEGAPVSLRGGGRFRFTSRMESDGAREIEFTGRDSAGHTVKAKIEVRRDSTPPGIEILDAPEEVLALVPTCEFKVRSDEPLSSLTVNGREVKNLDSTAETHTVRVDLQPGPNRFTVEARDLAGNKKIRTVPVNFKDLRTQEGKAQEERIFNDLQASLKDQLPIEQLQLLERFRENYPDSPRLPQIQKQIDDLSETAEEEQWKLLLDSVGGKLELRIQALEEYLERFKQGPHAHKAGRDLAFFRRLKGEPVALEKGPSQSIRINPGDGSTMIRIPANRYALFGKPNRRVTLSTCYMYENEVTASQFARFLNAVRAEADEGGHPLLRLPKASAIGVLPCPVVETNEGWRAREGFENHPAVYVTWYGAFAYARWTGGTLPSEAQWEAAANPTGDKPYFWGRGMNERFVWYVRNSEGGAQPVGTRNASLLGLNDMFGNVWEWCLDTYDPEYPNRPESRKNDPLNESPSPLRSVRGGAWNSPASQLQIHVRTGANASHAAQNIGFRVVFRTTD